jgi:MFS family permease
VYYPVAAALLKRRFDDIGRTIGLHEAGSNLGGFVAPVVVTGLLAVAGWRTTYLFSAGLLSVAVLLVGRTLGRTRPVNPDASLRDVMDRETILPLLTRPGLLVTAALGVVHEFAIQAIMSFLPAFLVAYHSLPIETAGLLFSAYFASVALAQPLTGTVSDRIGRDPAIAGVFLVGVGCFTALLLTDSVLVVTAATVSMGVAMSGGPPIHSRLLDRLAAEERGMGFGLCRTMFMLLGSSSPVILGIVVDTWGWGRAYGLAGVVLVVGVLFLVVQWLLPYDL